MYWEQIGFCVFAIGFTMLSSVKTIDKYRFYLKKKKILKNLSETYHSRQELINKIAESGIVVKNNDGTEEKLEPYDGKQNFSQYLKVIINYCMTFNSAFLVVGSLAESYFYGARMIGNIISITLGYIYAFFIVHPFMYSLEDDIKTPYQYFERRYGNKKYVRAITAGAGMLFYFFFLSLYLWGCGILLSTLIPEIPLWISSVLIGAYSITGSTIGGFTQSTKTNIFQFFILITGLIMTLFLTVTKQSPIDLSHMWKLATENNRTNFFDYNVDLTTRYTILNQSISLSIPWTCFHSLLLPNFIRYRNIPGKNRSKFLIISNFPFMVLLNLLLLISGSIFCFIYFYGCDPIASQKLVHSNQLGTYWIYNVLSEDVPSFAGIMFACIIAYSIVQHSMGLSLCGHTIFCEIIKPMIFDYYILLKNRDIIEHWTKIILIVALGILSTCVSIGFQYLKNTMLSLFFVFNNTIHSPILGLFILSVFNPYSNSVGAMSAFVCNLAINFWLALGNLFFSLLKSQKFQPDISQCNSSYYSDMSPLNLDYDSPNTPAPLTSDDYYPKNFLLAYLYSIAPIWYCLFSLLFTNIFGTLFSFIYSLIKTGSLDADRQYNELRKSYLYFYRLSKTKNKYQN